jgi:hypothetical protein
MRPLSQPLCKLLERGQLSQEEGLTSETGRCWLGADHINLDRFTNDTSSLAAFALFTIFVRIFHTTIPRLCSFERICRRPSFCVSPVVHFVHKFRSVATRFRASIFMVQLQMRLLARNRKHLITGAALKFWNLVCFLPAGLKGCALSRGLRKRAIWTVKAKTMPTTISAASVVRLIVFFGLSAAYFMFFA